MCHPIKYRYMFMFCYFLPIPISLDGSLFKNILFDVKKKINENGQ